MQADIYNPVEQSSGKDRIDKVISEIEAIEYSGKEFDACDYSNDRAMTELIPQVAQLSNEIPGEIRAVVIVGSGTLWNLPKELNDIDLIISLDINPNQHLRNRQRKQEILSTQKPEDLLPTPNFNIDPEDIIAVVQERFRMEAPRVEMESYDKYHYLYSQQELEKTKMFLANTKIAHVCGNIADSTFTSQLGNILHTNGVNIVLANFSNVSEWECGSIPDPTKRDGLINALKLLPISDKCPIVHSRHTGRTGRSPIVSKFSTGLNTYAQSLMRKDDLVI